MCYNSAERFAFLNFTSDKYTYALHDPTLFVEGQSLQLNEKGIKFCLMCAVACLKNTWLKNTTADERFITIWTEDDVY